MLANRCSLCYGAQRCQEIAVSENTLPTLCMCDLNMHASPQHGVNLDYPREADAWEKCCSTCRTSIGLGPSGGKIGALALDSHISNVNVMFMSGELASAQRSWGAPLGNCRLVTTCCLLRSHPAHPNQRARLFILSRHTSWNTRGFHC